MFTRRALVALALLAANAMAEDICPGISLLFKGTPEVSSKLCARGSIE